MKYRIGTREIIAAVVGGMIYLAVSALAIYMEGYSDFGRHMLYWVEPVEVIVIIVGALFGPFAGSISGAGGCMLSGITLSGSIDFTTVFRMIILGWLVGRYSERIGGESIAFGRQEVMDFNAVSLLALAISNVLYYPTIGFLLGRSSIFAFIKAGVMSFVGTGLVTMVLGTLLVALGRKIRKDIINHTLFIRKSSRKTNDKPEQSEASKILDSYKWK